jgi:hypothetical protein
VDLGRKLRLLGVRVGKLVRCSSAEPWPAPRNGELNPGEVALQARTLELF